MPLTLSETQAINELAGFIYDFLPGKPHPYADQTISFPGVARKLGLSQYWRSGSKQPAVTTLLENTIEIHRNKFCDLILEIVRTGMKYRSSKHNPITREEIVALNELIERLNFRIPELWSPEFLDTLPRMPRKNDNQDKTTDSDFLSKLRQRHVKLTELNPQERGYAFEKFLQEFFLAFDLAPRPPFKLIGEQIDGSFQIGPHTYLVEAKWQNIQTNEADLLVFDGKVGGKAKWSRGLFISYNGFTEDGLVAFSKGRSTNILGMTGQDIYFILEGIMTLVEAIDKKARRAAEEGDFFVSVFELSKEG